MDILFSCNIHCEFFFFTILVATIRQLVDSMELGLAGPPKLLSSRLKSEKSLILTIRWNLANLEKTYHGIIALQCLIDPRRMELPKEQCAEKKDVCGIVAIRSGRKMVGRFHGVLLLSATHTRSLV